MDNGPGRMPVCVWMYMRTRVSVDVRVYHLKRADGNLGAFSTSSSTFNTSRATPRAITALLQGGYWSQRFTPDRIFNYSYTMGALWIVCAGVVAVVVATLLPRRVRPERTRHRRTVASAALWALGRVVGVFVFVYSLLAVTTVRDVGLVVCVSECVARTH